MKAVPNAQYVEGLKNRSHSVFEALFRIYYPPLCRFAYSYLMNRLQAEDIVQDVFASLWRNADSLKDDLNIRQYIYTSVKHACLDYLKHIRVIDSNQDKLTESLVFSGTVEYEENSELLRKIDACLGELPGQQRRILELKLNKKMSYREIATEMGISEATVHTHIKRAYGTIRDKLPVLFILMRMWDVL